MSKLLFYFFYAIAAGGGLWVAFELMGAWAWVLVVIVAAFTFSLPALHNWATRGRIDE